jgi:hypothetical protein
MEFIYYDETSATLKRVGRTSGAVKEQWTIKKGSTTAMQQDLPLKRVSMLNADGSAGEGFVPVDIDALIAIAEGDDFVEIQEDSQFIYEVSGAKPGEVLRVASAENSDDCFDLVVPGSVAKLTPREKNADLISVSPGVYRTAQKVVVYSTGPGSPQMLTGSQWNSLKALGYLAVHNDSAVVRCASDIDRFLMENGISDLHPKSDLVYGKPSDSATFRHKGFTDHHPINVYHRNTTKGPRWRNMLKEIFGSDFDPDEFTIPVHAKLHRKTQHLATQVWDNFIEGPGGIDGLFDSQGKLLPGVTSDQVADLRYRTWTAMDDSINAMSGTRLKLDRGRMRIWPAVLDHPNHPLRQKFLDGGWRMGSSAGRYLSIEKTVIAGVKDATKLARLKNIRKTLMRNALKNGVKAFAISLACSVLKGYAAWETAAGVLVNGWQETLAQKLNEELFLDDIDIARQIVAAAFSDGLIPGGTRVVKYQLPNGNIIVEGDPTFRIYYSNGMITAIDGFVVTEMKKFPEGSFKMAIVRIAPPHDHKIIEDPPWFIRNWYPHVGAYASEYFDAAAKAESNLQ